MNDTKIEVKTRDPSKPSTGDNTEVYIDGNLIKHAKSLKFEVEAGGMAKVTIEMYGNFTAEVVGEVSSHFVGIEDKSKGHFGEGDV